MKGRMGFTNIMNELRTLRRLLPSCGFSCLLSDSGKFPRTFHHLHG